MRTKRTLIPAAVLAVCVGPLLATAAAQERVERLFPADVTIWVNRANIEFRVYKNEAAIYEFGRDLAKPYFWPLETSNSRQVTRSWPMRKDGPDESRDHPHQKSAWFTYGDVIPEGMKFKKKKGVEGIDFWAEGPDCGRIVCMATSKGENDQNRAWVTTYNEWQTPDGDKIMDEVRKIQFYNWTTARLFIVDIDLHASVAPITFGDTKEGAFGVRVADSLREDRRGGGQISNAEGKVGEKNCWGRISNWCDYSGTVNGDIVGIAIFAGADNPIPTCWHCRGYGLMAANPFGRAKSGFPAMKEKKDTKDLVRIEKGKHLKMRYALFLHLGDAKQGKVAQRYEEFKKMK